MHDRAARPTGAVKSAATIASEIMFLLNIDFRIAQVRPRVEEGVQRQGVLLVFLLCSGSAIMFMITRTRCFWLLLATGLRSIVKAFEVATNMLVVIMESSENHLKGENYEH
jgi:hypothetical protein